MIATHSQMSSAPHSRWRARLSALALAILSLTTGLNATADEPIAAVLKARELSFFFRTSTPIYACHELRGAVSAILRAVGARDDIQVNVNGCDTFVEPEDSMSNRPFGRRGMFDEADDRFGTQRTRRDESAHVRVRMMSPVPVTPEVLAEMERDKSRRELVSRVTRNPAAKMNDPIVFPAQRQTLTLNRKLIRLEPRDCLLLEQMSNSIFRELDVRVIRRNFSCDSRQTSMITPQLTVEALLPVNFMQRELKMSDGTSEPTEPQQGEAAAPEAAAPSTQPPQGASTEIEPAVQGESTEVVVAPQ